MAARKEILSDLSTKIADGNIREAYRTFEELPVVDQIAVSISPGVGDALAAYEIGEFGSRAKTNIEDKDYLGAAGNVGLSALSGISLIPLFRFLRGARGVTKSATKLADAPPPIKPPTREPLQLAPPKITEPELPKVEPFQPKGIQDIGYNTTQPSIQLSSKARKWVNGLHPKSPSKKVQELAPEEWVNRLIDAGIPKGELRLLRILDEANEINPKFLNETAGSKTISRGFLDDYMARQQRDAIQMRGVPETNLQDPNTRFANVDLQRTQNQAVYFVRGSGEYRSLKDHYKRLDYKDGQTGDTAYVFDGVGINDPRSRFELAYGFDDSSQYIQDGKKIKGALDEINLKEGDQIDSIFRVQSDFQGEVAEKQYPKMKRDFTSTIKTIENTDSLPFININNASRSYSENITDQLRGLNSQSRMLSQNLNPNFVNAVANADVDGVKKILGNDLYKVFTDKTLAQRIPGKFFAPNDAFDVGDTGRSVSFTEFVDGFLYRNPKMTQKEAIDTMFNKLGVNQAIKDLGTEAETLAVVETIFKQRRSIDAINKKIIGKSGSARGGFVDPVQQKVILKKLKDYNRQVDEINASIASGANIDVDRIIGKLNRSVLDLDIDKMSISPRDIEKITGKPFSESLDKTTEDIFYTMKDGKQTYIDVPNNPADLAKAYFDDIADEGTTFFKLANGVKVLKKAVGINAKEFGMKIDPYFDGGNSKYMKLPVRARILDAYRKGRQGVHIGKQQAITESSPERVIQNYSSGEKEIQKILDELIPKRANQKGMISKVEGTNTEYDGTYLKFTDDLKKAIEEQGIDAFKLGGPVEIDRMLADL
tara:strand:+ start:956 stop:3427 length:2472 start_codon:yes stop_codon:yes gene_type:complete